MRKKDQELKKNLKQIEICIFPEKPVDHYGFATPFVICDDQIIDRPINRSYFAHLKKGLGADILKDIEQPKSQTLAAPVKLTKDKASKIENLVLFN